MLIDRRTYRIRGGHWDDALALITQIRQLSHDKLGWDFEILTSRYGPFQTVMLEFPFDDESEQVPFLHEKFYPALEERDWLSGWFSHVLYADAHNLKTENGDGVPTEKAAQAPRPGMLVHRLYHEPAGGVGSTWDTSLKIQELTHNQFQRSFRITRFHFSGMMASMFWDFCYTDHEDQQEFEKAWYAFLTEKGIMTDFSSQVSRGNTELWYSLP